MHLIATLAIALPIALLAGFLARRLRLSPIVGYMLAGILVGPHTPGPVADSAVATEFAEIGIILLMFGVGLHFSLKDLVAVRRVAVPGAVVQSAVATLLGIGIGSLCGWGLGGGLVFGLALSVASTVVLIRGLMDKDELHSIHGHVAVGWLVVEDLFTVFLLVLLPALSGLLGGHGQDRGAALGWTLLLTLAKVSLLSVVVLVVGGRGVPWLLATVARTGSRELFTLVVLSVALGVAYGSAELCGVSMALGAFLGGVVVGQSDLSHQAAADALPMRDAFAVLFFVSVGMLFDPHVVTAHPGLLLASLAVVLVAKPVVAFLVVIWRGWSTRTALTVSAGLAQVGEFSFILAAQGRELGLLPTVAANAILATALFSVAVNPLLFRSVAPLENALRSRPRVATFLARRARELGELPTDAGDHPLHDHVVLCGHGRVGSMIATAVRQRGWPLAVIEQDRALVEELRRAGVGALNGDAANPILLDHAHLARARLLVVAVPDPLTVRQVVEHARRARPDLPIVARVHDRGEQLRYAGMDATDGVWGEFELGMEMTRQVLQRSGVGAVEIEAALMDLRADAGGAAVRGQTRVRELQVQPGAPAVGRRIAELGLGKGTLIVTVHRGGEFVIPNGQTELRAGDRLLVIADADGRERIAVATGTPA